MRSQCSLCMFISTCVLGDATTKWTTKTGGGKSAGGGGNEQRLDTINKKWAVNPSPSPSHSPQPPAAADSSIVAQADNPPRTPDPDRSVNVQVLLVIVNLPTTLLSFDFILSFFFTKLWVKCAKICSSIQRNSCLYNF